MQHILRNQFNQFFLIRKVTNSEKGEKLNELLKVNFDTQTVSARELHEKLNIGTKFATWFERMKEYGFTEGNEFCPILGKTSEQGGRPTVDYDISVDMAKQICMIQRSPEGKQIREYFINLEKAWNTPEQIFARALKMADKVIADKDKQIETMKSVIKEIEPKANYVDTILKNKSTVLISQIANDYGMSAIAFNKLLKELHIQHKVGNQWILYAEHQGNGYVHSGTFEFERKDGSKDVNMNTEWTQKGRLFLYEMLKKDGIVPDIEKGEQDESI